MKAISKGILLFMLAIFIAGCAIIGNKIVVVEQHIDFDNNSHFERNK